MSVIAFLRQLLDDGLDYETAIKAADRFEQRALAAAAARADERRAKDAARQQAKRERERHAESRGQAVTSRDSRGPSPHVGAGAPVVIPFSSSFQSEEVGVGGVGAGERVPPADDWPPGRASDHAALLVDAVASPWLDPQKSPDLVTTRGRVAAWKRDGASWEHDVLPVVTGLCANRRSRIVSWKFFDDAISRSIAENRAALTIPAAEGRRHSTGPPNITDRIAAENAEARRRVLES